MLSNRQLFLNYLAQTTDFPLLLEIEKAEGVWLKDTNGKEYIDLISGIGVSNVGHRHPKVLEAIQLQLDKYLHLMVYGEYVQTSQVKLAEALVSSLPEPLDQVYLVNSGSEAIEGAIKIAKRYTGKYEIISCRNAYHGSTHGALSIGGDESFKRAYRPLVPGTGQIEFGKIQDLKKINQQTSAVVVETVQGEAGVRVAGQSYFSALSKQCKETGALLILDEIQAGFGRTGKLWAFEKYNIVPDIITCAKGMGGGMPIGAFIASKAIMSVIKQDPILGHITTFGGHPVSAAASLATMKVIREEQLLDQVEAKANLFKKLLVHDKIKEIRNSGLMMAVQFESFEILKPIIDRAMKLGVITDWFLYCDSAMRIAPPLTITSEEIKQSCQKILQAVDQA